MLVWLVPLAWWLAFVSYATETSLQLLTETMLRKPWWNHPPLLVCVTASDYVLFIWSILHHLTLIGLLRKTSVFNMMPFEVNKLYVRDLKSWAPPTSIALHQVIAIKNSSRLRSLLMPCLGRLVISYICLLFLLTVCFLHFSFSSVASSDDQLGELSESKLTTKIWEYLSCATALKIDSWYKQRNRNKHLVDKVKSITQSEIVSPTTFLSPWNVCISRQE